MEEITPSPVIGLWSTTKDSKSCIRTLNISPFQNINQAVVAQLLIAIKPSSAGIITKTTETEDATGLKRQKRLLPLIPSTK